MPTIDTIDALANWYAEGACYKYLPDHACRTLARRYKQADGRAYLMAKCAIAWGYRL